MQDVTRACLMRRLVVTPMPYTHRHTRTITCMSMVQYTHTHQRAKVIHKPFFAGIRILHIYLVWKLRVCVQFDSIRKTFQDSSWLYST